MYRVLVVSDISYPWGNTGFGIVIGQLLKGLYQSGQFQISHLGRGEPRQGIEEPPFRVYTPPYADSNGYSYIGHVCDLEKPELIVFEADPESIMHWRANVQARTVPNLCHVPVEGAPLLGAGAQTLKEIVVTQGLLTTYTGERLLRGFRARLFRHRRRASRDRDTGMGRVPGGGVGAVGKWPAGATVKSLALGRPLIHSGGHRRISGRFWFGRQTDQPHRGRRRTSVRARPPTGFVNDPALPGSE